MNVEDYKKGFLDGAAVESKISANIYIMGYSFDKIIELIQKDREKQRIVIDHIDKGPIIVKRHGKIIYEE